jgi:uncharacterized membrane protein
MLYVLGVYAYSLFCTSQLNSETCTIEDRLATANLAINLLPIVAGLGVIGGALVYYVLDKRTEEALKKGKEVADVVLKFLKQDERKIINYLLSKNGQCLQAELSRLEDVGKLRAHRAIKKLEKLGVITSEGIGKTNIVRLDEGLLKYLK